MRIKTASVTGRNRPWDPRSCFDGSRLCVECVVRDVKVRNCKDLPIPLEVIDRIDDS